MDVSDDRARVCPPRLEDVARICRSLNEAEVRYVLIGGLAVRAHGGERTTKDLDVLVDPTPENIARVETAFTVLWYMAAGEAANRDEAVPKWGAVHVDVFAEASGVTWEAATIDAVDVEMAGVVVPVAGIRTLIASKQSARTGGETDAMDIKFLRSLLGETAAG